MCIHMGHHALSGLQLWLLCEPWPIHSKDNEIKCREIEFKTPRAADWIPLIRRHVGGILGILLLFSVAVPTPILSPT
jgi:hypothetical protein